ncbi:MAG: recombinase family protein [Sulfuricella sp.]|nr:recombinase family protein [Sulfuricella sp.]
MNGQFVGYLRVSTADQNLERQREGVRSAGITLDIVFEDQASGKDTLRPKFQEMCQYVRRGDTLVVYSIDRLARSLTDLERAVEDLNAKGVQVFFVKENLKFAGSGDEPFAVLQRQLLGSFAQFERALIRERQREGIEIAKQKGKYKGRKPALSAERAGALRERAAAGEKHADLIREFAISRATFYRLLKTGSAD